MTGWRTAGAFPSAPLNGQILSGYSPGMLDLRWDDPSGLSSNAAFAVVGVNIYRSDVSDRGPYHRINPYPVGGAFYRDQTTVEYVSETIRWDTGWVQRGVGPNNRSWVLKTQSPIVQRDVFADNGAPTYSSRASDVTITIDGVRAYASQVLGLTGEVWLVNAWSYDNARDRIDQPPLPSEHSVVVVSYWTVANHVRSGLERHVYYRLATVATDSETLSGLVETPLEYCPPLTVGATETLDYIWRRAVSMNSWILQQGGERVKLFVRRLAGVQCSCQRDARTLEYTKQPSSMCGTCYGTGYQGGYEGPYDIIISPDDAEKRISRGIMGLRKEHTQEVWTGPSPLITQRDFYVKQTNERYSVGPVRRPTARGMILQQHFQTGYLDEQDIRYRVPMDGVSDLLYPETRYSHAPTDDPPHPVGTDATDPMITNKPSIEAGRQLRGRTGVSENTTY